MYAYFRPKTRDEAVAILRDGPCRIVAGCTDYYAALPRPDDTARFLDLTQLHDTRGISETATGLRIGALTPWSEIALATLPPGLDALSQAARQIGGVQIQNAGTLGGNLCNASPAADGVPPLLILDAEVELLGPRGARRMALADFLVGNRRTRLAADEFMTAIHVFPPQGRHASAFEKLGARAYQVISISMVAMLLEVDARHRVIRAAVAVGACSATAQRLPNLEAALTGHALDTATLLEIPIAPHLGPLAPISDIRATAEYRLDATVTLSRRAIVRLREALA